MRKRFLAIVMAVCMLLSIMPTAAFAADETYTHTTNASSDDDAVQVTKTVTYDGSSYNISLEAFVTGTVTSTSTSTPLDIVLVVDQSGSMAYDDDGSTTDTESERRYYALKSAMNSFVSTIANDAKENDVDHRIAIVGYAANATSSASGFTGTDITSGSSSSSWINTGIYIDGTMKNYQTLTYTEVYSSDNDFSTSSTYYVLVDGAYYSVSYNRGGQGGQGGQQQAGWYYTTGNGPNSTRVSVTPKTSESDTSGTQFYTSEYVDLTADDYKASLVSAYDADSSGVTSSITTAISNIAVSGGTYTQYGLLMAQGVFDNNSATYTYTDDNGDTQTGTRKRIVVLFTDGETNSDISNVLTASNALKSSTYNATVYTVGFGSSVNETFLTYVSSEYSSDTSYSWQTYSGTYVKDGYYLAASDSSSLSSVFETIASEAVASSVTVDSSSVLTDTLSGYFTLPDTVISDSGVTVYKVPVVSGTDNGDGTYTYTWGTEEDITDEVTIEVDSDAKTVSVTGYDYSAAPVVYSESTETWSGYKLVVEFEVIPDTDCTEWSASGNYATNAGAVLDYGDSEEDAVEVDDPVAPVETYQVTYSWNWDTVYSDGATLYNEDGTQASAPVLPTDDRYYITDQSYTVDTEYTDGTVLYTHDAYGNVNGTYTFSGWDDTNNGTITNADVTITGTWTYETVDVATHSVTYDWGTENIPSEVTLPTDSSTYVKGESYTVDTKYTSDTVIYTYDTYGNETGKYTFSGWTDPNNGTMGNSDVTITGSWTYEAVTVKEYSVTYSWSGDVPESAVLPTDETAYVNGQAYTVDTEYTSETVVYTYDAYGNINGQYTLCCLGVNRREASMRRL